MSDLPSALQAAQAAGHLLASTVENIEKALQSPLLPDWGRLSIKELVEQEKWTELNDRFFKQLAFGTGGIRGKTISGVTTSIEQGEPQPLDRPEHAAIGSAMFNTMNLKRANEGLGQYLIKNYTERPLKVVISHDTRHFSRQFAEETASTLAARGIQAYLFPEDRSTPQLSWAVRWLKAHAGIMITASHNPPQYNGYKGYGQDGGQFVEPHASGIIAEVNAIDEHPLGAPEDESASITVVGPEADDAYIDAVSTLVIDEDAVKEGAPQVKIVFTPLHGVGSRIAPRLLERFGFPCSLVQSQNDGDGRFPTVQSPNPENAEALTLGEKQAEAEGADLVIATDPDADRMGVLARDQHGKLQLLTGNMIGSIMAAYRCEAFFNKGILNDSNKGNAALIKTYVTTDLQKNIANHYGIKCVDTLTGFKYIGEKLDIYEKQCGLDNYDAQPLEARRAAQLEKGTFFVFGGEESYGYSGGDYVRDKDANAAVLMFAEAAAYAKTKGMTVPEYLDSIYRKFGYFRERLGTLTFEGAAGAQKIKDLLASYKDNPPADFLGSKVTDIKNFAEDSFEDVDGKPLPKELMLLFSTEDGNRMAVRASGTEPKIKFYFFTQRQATDNSALATAKEECADYLEKWWDAIQADVEERVG